MKRIEKKLLKLFGQLTEAQQETLLSFAAFLAEREQQNPSDAPQLVPAPQLLERPENESVIAAIKRLKASYPMVEREKVFDETSALMTQHVMQGRNANEIIDDLEIMFRRHYEALISEALVNEDK